MQEVKLENSDTIDLCDLLKLSKLCENGGAAKHLISEGLVKVDGKVELRRRAKIRKGQTIEFKGTTLKLV